MAAPSDEIVYVGFLTGHGGDAVQMEMLAMGMHERGARVRILVPEADTSVEFAERCRDNGLRCERTPWIRADATGPSQDMRSMVALCRSLGTPLVHFHTGNSCLPRSLTLAMAITRSPRAFVTIQSPYETFDPKSLRGRWWGLEARRRFHAIASPSEHSSSFQRACGVPDSRIVTIRNAIDPTQIAAGDGSGVRAELGMRSDQPLVVFTSRLDPTKRPIDAVEIFSQVADEFPDAVLAMIGTGTETDGVEEMARHHGIGDRVRLLGHRSDVADWLAAATVWILPTERENFSVAVLEAMAAGLPVLSTMCRGNDEVLVHDENALVFDIGDVSGGAAGLRRLLGDGELRDRLGRRAHECSLDYSADVMIDSYRELYRRAEAPDGAR